jgi:polyhydroxyalkanoate synthesis regulator phasin
MPMDQEETIRDFLGERPRAAQLSEWRETLERRLEALLRERERVTDGVPASLDGRIAQLERQVAALREEEAVTQFVEDSVRVTLTLGEITGRVDEDYEE